MRLDISENVDMLSVQYLLTFVSSLLSGEGTSPPRTNFTDARAPARRHISPAIADHHYSGDHMPRIIVTTDPVASEPTDETAVLLEEQVHSVHLSTGHAAAQLVERLAWAIGDAEKAEQSGGARATRRVRRDATARSVGSVPRSRRALSA
jgi:hypothetical protein